MTMINISNVVSISVIVPPAGLANYSVNNLVCFTKDTPDVSLGTDLYAAYASAAEVATAWGTDSNTYAAAVSVFSQSPNILTGGGLFIVVPMLAQEVLATALVRAAGYFYYGGAAATFAGGITGSTGPTGPIAESLEAAATAQTLGKLVFFAETEAATYGDNGLGYEVQDASYTKSRVLFHTNHAQAEALKWGYASRGMSTNFAGNNTTSTMHLKTLVGVTADTAITQAILTSLIAVGADCYPNVAGVAAVFCSGENGFFDDIYNLIWLVGALEVAGFNYLRTSGTKIPQTESGMDGLKAAYRRVCMQSVTNGFVARGTWTGSDTFGDPETFNRNIGDLGYYVYSLPVALQSAADRADRIAPVIQIAVKYAGAIHSSDVIVNINA